MDCYCYDKALMRRSMPISKRIHQKRHLDGISFDLQLSNPRNFILTNRDRQENIPWHAYFLHCWILQTKLPTLFSALVCVFSLPVLTCRTRQEVRERTCCSFFAICCTFNNPIPSFSRHGSGLSWSRDSTSSKSGEARHLTKSCFPNWNISGSLSTR